MSIELSRFDEYHIYFEFDSLSDSSVRSKICTLCFNTCASLFQFLCAQILKQISQSENLSNSKVDLIASNLLRSKLNNLRNICLLACFTYYFQNAAHNLIIFFFVSIDDRSSLYRRHILIFLMKNGQRKEENICFVNYCNTTYTTNIFFIENAFFSIEKSTHTIFYNLLILKPCIRPHTQPQHCRPPFFLLRKHSYIKTKLH